MLPPRRGGTPTCLPRSSRLRRSTCVVLPDRPDSGRPSRAPWDLTMRWAGLGIPLYKPAASTATWFACWPPRRLRDRRRREVLADALPARRPYGTGSTPGRVRARGADASARLLPTTGFPSRASPFAPSPLTSRYAGGARTTATCPRRGRCTGFAERGADPTRARRRPVLTEPVKSTSRGRGRPRDRLLLASSAPM